MTLLTLIFYALILTFLITILYWYYYYYFTFLTILPNLKYPRTWPIIGSVIDALPLSEVLSHILRLRKQYGKTFKSNLIFSTIVFTTDEKFVEGIATSKNFLSKAHEYDYLRPWLGDGLLTSTGNKWMKRRKLLTPSFHFNILQDFISVFNNCGNILIDKLRNEVDKESTNVYPYITLCALDVIYEATMGIKVNAQIEENSIYVKTVRSQSEIAFSRMFHPIKRSHLLYQLSYDYFKERANLKIMHDTTDSIIAARRDLLLSRNNNDLNANGDSIYEKKRKSFLDILLESTADDGLPLTNIDIREEVDTFLFEGHDTTSSAITYALYELSLNWDVQEKAVEELKLIFGKERNRSITSDDLNEMKYLDQVIKETLRKYPSVPVIARRIDADYVYDGVVYPKGITLAFIPYMLHREADTFPDPERFDPERFSIQNRSKIGPYAYIPFSAGYRNCIGQKFAMLELKSLLSKILRNYELHPVKEFQPKNVAQLILRSRNGINMKIMDRKEW